MFQLELFVIVLSIMELGTLLYLRTSRDALLRDFRILKIGIGIITCIFLICFCIVEYNVAQRVYFEICFINIQFDIWILVNELFDN